MAERFCSLSKAIKRRKGRATHRLQTSLLNKFKGEFFKSAFQVWALKQVWLCNWSSLPIDFLCKWQGPRLAQRCNKCIWNVILQSLSSIARGQENTNGKIYTEKHFYPYFNRKLEKLWPVNMCTADQPQVIFTTIWYSVHSCYMAIRGERSIKHGCLLRH